MKARKFAAGVLALVTAFLLAGCGILTNGPDTTPNDEIETPEEQLPADDEDLTEGLPEREGSVSETYLLYEEAKKEGYEGGYLDFLADYQLPEKEGADPVQTALRSIVRVTATFRVRSYGTVTSVASGGAGIVWSVSGAGDMLVVTNYHVVYNKSSIGTETHPNISDSIVLNLYGGTDDIAATYAGGSMDHDIALLRVRGEDSAEDGKTNADILKESAVQGVKLASSADLLAGERVYAVGNPNDDGISATEGIVSVETETITMTRLNGSGSVSMYEIRTDAALNHGNSGGGLFNAKGEFIGLVNARSEEDGVEAFGYAIPSDLVIAVVDNIVDNGGHVLCATLGITVTASRSSYVLQGDALRIRETVEVKSVESGAAASGKLQVGDHILSLEWDGTVYPVLRQISLSVSLLKVREGETVLVVVERGGEEVTVELSFGESNFTQIK